MGMAWLRSVRGHCFTLGLAASLAAAALPAAALDFSPVVLRRTDTQGLVSELFLYDLTAQEIHLLRQRLSQPVMDDALTQSYEPALTELVPVTAEGPGDKLLTLLRPANTSSRDQAQDTVLIVFQGTTLHARRYRMPSAYSAQALASSQGAENAQQAGPSAAMFQPAALADKPPLLDAGAEALAAITAAVKHWARAWEQRDVAAYAAAYEPSFRGAGSLAPAPSNAAWLAQRRERILSKRVIEVALEDIQISLQSVAPSDAPKAHVRFLQRYRGDELISVARKRLGLVWRDGVWLIREEVSL
jgi:hypothetical protein